MTVTKSRTTRLSIERNGTATPRAEDTAATTVMAERRGSATAKPEEVRKEDGRKTSESRMIGTATEVGVVVCSGLGGAFTAVKTVGVYHTLVVAAADGAAKAAAVSAATALKAAAEATIATGTAKAAATATAVGAAKTAIAAAAAAKALTAQAVAVATFAASPIGIAVIVGVGVLAFGIPAAWSIWGRRR